MIKIRTKKLGVTGRFGTRYGATLRKRVKAIEEVQKAKHECPHCHTNRVTRYSAGIWECQKLSCKKKFTGGSFMPATDPGRASIRDTKRLNLTTTKK